MLAWIKITPIVLLSFIFQNSSCFKHNPNQAFRVSVEQHIGKLSDPAALDPVLKERIFAVLKPHRLYEHCLKSIGIEPNLQPMQLSPDQAAKLGKINLILIDLYHIFDKAVETVKDKGDAPNELPVGREEMLDCMGDILQYAIAVSENPSSLEMEADLLENDPNSSDVLKTYMELVDTIKDGYVIPLNSYINGGDWPALEKVVNIARLQTYQAIRDFLEAIEADQSERQESDA